jgi:hypothetical protein
LFFKLSPISSHLIVGHDYYTLVLNDTSPGLISIILT